MNLALNIPHLAILAFTDVVAGTFERLLTLIPSSIIVNQIVPPGVEASMAAFTSTIVTFNLFGLRGLIGALINDYSVQINRQTI